MSRSFFLWVLWSTSPLIMVSSVYSVVIQTEVRPSMTASALLSHCITLYKRQTTDPTSMTKRPTALHDSLIDAGNYRLRLCDEDGTIDDDYPAVDDLAALSTLVPLLEARSVSSTPTSHHRSTILRSAVEAHFALELRDPTLLDLLRYQQQQNHQHHLQPQQQQQNPRHTTHVYSRRKTTGGGEMIESMHRYRLYQWLQCCRCGQENRWDDSDTESSQSPQSPPKSKWSKWLCCG